MTTIADFKGEDPHLLIDLAALARGDVRYVTAGFSEPANSKPEEASVCDLTGATLVVKVRRPYRALAAVPYPVAVLIQNLLERRP